MFVRQLFFVKRKINSVYASEGSSSASPLNFSATCFGVSSAMKSEPFVRCVAYRSKATDGMDVIMYSFPHRGTSNLIKAALAWLINTNFSL